MPKLWKTGCLLTLTFLALAQPSWGKDFAKSQPGRLWQFPRDHGDHREFQTEWWYFTGHLKSSQGRMFGFQWTVFRTSLIHPQELSPNSASPWRGQSLYAGHVAVSDLANGKFYHQESFSRESLGMAGSKAEHFEVWLPGVAGRTQGGHWILQAQKPPIGMDLKLQIPTKPVFHGSNGFSPKAPGVDHASHYYSLPKIPLEGTLQLLGKNYRVTGQAWMDQEFGSNQLSETQTGWDWFGLPLGEAGALMVYQLRDRRGPEHDYLSGTYVSPAGEVIPLSKSEIRLSSANPQPGQASGALYPNDWVIHIPDQGIKLQVKAAFPSQELATPGSTQVQYWEGSVQVTGNIKEQKVQSKGYLEMTGYAKPFETPI